MFNAVDAPIEWDLIENFSFEDSESKRLLRSNPNILVGNLGHAGQRLVYKTPLYRYLDLFVHRKFLRNILLEDRSPPSLVQLSWA